jgi:hypothetical protein
MVGIWKDGLKREENMDDKRKIFRIKLYIYRFVPVLKTFFHTWEWYIKIFLKYRKKKLEVVHCNSIADLPLGVMFKVLLPNKKIKLVYDAHELETEKSSLKGIRKKIYKISERIFIKHVDKISVVSLSIADWYEREYKISNIALIKNIPSSSNNNEVKKENKSLRNTFGIKSNRILFLYLGELKHERMVMTLLKIFKETEIRDKHIIFMGHGELENIIKEYARLYENIHYKDSISPDELNSYEFNIDIGLSVLDNSNLNHYFCLPNKFFFYIQRGIPLIVSDFPEMTQLIYEFNIGWSVNANQSDLYKLIKEINIDSINEKKKNYMINKMPMPVWETEEEVLLEMYKNL